MRTPDPWTPPLTPFTLAHVAARGVSRRQLQTALASGRITRLRQGVFIATEAMPEDPVGIHVIRALAEQVVAPGRVASHETAALALGLPLRRTRQAAEGMIHVTRPAAAQERTRRTEHLRVHLGIMPEHHVVTTAAGLRVTTAARTALDVACGLDLPDALMIVDAAIRQELLELAGSLDRRHYRNTRLLLAAARPIRESLPIASSPRTARHLVLVLSLADVRRESPLESFGAGHMQAFAREKIREGHLRDLGSDVVRWTGREGFESPELVLDRIRRALAGRGWRP